MPRSSAWLAIAALVAACASGSRGDEHEFLGVEQRAADFAAFCRFVEEEYAYFDLKKTDWTKVCGFHAPRVAEAADRAAYIGLLEHALAELYDPHAHLGTNTRSSYRLVPSQTDLFAAWKDGKAVLLDVRRGSGAERAGLLPGMEVTAVDGEATANAVRSVEPTMLSAEDPAAREWALQVALAGRRDRDVVRIAVRVGDREREFAFVPGAAEATAMLSHRVIRNVGYVRINNSLGQPELVRAFDDVLADLVDVEALVIDLRDTPSGGNSAVARGIMSRLVDRTLPYQRHELVADFRSTGIRRIWVEYVAPRGVPFAKPIVVLVGRWTGSMGEGLAIGLNATRGAPVVGRPMAHLLGAIGETVLPQSKIVVRLPTEKLFHVDGMPREAFVPCAISSAGPHAPGEDRDLEGAISAALQSSASKPGASRTEGGNACPA